MGAVKESQARMKINTQLWSTGVTPCRILVLGYAIVTLAGAWLLTLPKASASGQSQSFLDALFMATTAISTCGLVVVDVGTYYSFFGQVVFLAIVQIGGIGYMGFVVAVLWALGVRHSYGAFIVAKESLAGGEFGRLRRFFAVVLVFTALVEAAGAVPLALEWSRLYPWRKAVYMGIFHSVNAFCTSGVSLLPDSLIGWRDNPTVNLTVIVLSLLGGLGFIVLIDVGNAIRQRLRRRHGYRVSEHSKLVLAVTGVLVGGSTLLLFLGGPWPAGMGYGDRLMAAGFQAVSASTTDGFNTVDIGALGSTSLVVLMVLMFIGASPGSTGGGIKTTTAGVLALFGWRVLRGGETVEAFHRTLPDDALRKSVAVLAGFVAVLLVDLLILTATEGAPFLSVLFEIVSALGNTGLSTGITGSLSRGARAALIVTMFVGRVGPLAIGLALTRPRSRGRYAYASADLHIG